jgi:hypothetical protein
MTRTMSTDRRRPQPASPRQQRGALALLVTSLLFLMSMLILLYVNRGAVAEQRMSANELRAKAAFAQATAGIDHALAYMRSGGIDQVAPVGPDPVSGGRYRAAFCSLAAEPPACPNTLDTLAACAAPADPADVLAYACGWSDDNSSVQRVVQHLRGTASTAGNASTPLISKSATNILTGGPSIFNFENDLTVWAGAEILSQSNTGKTFVRDTFNYPREQPANINPRNTGNSPGCNNPPTGYTCTTQGSTIGHDVVVGDTSLSLATNDAFFQRFMGKPPDVYKETVVLPQFVVAPNQVSSLGAAANGNVIWVNGNLTLGSNLGTADRPVILIVDGDLAFNGSPEINGIVFVRGNLDTAASPTIYGSMIVAGQASGNGSMKIIYDSNVIARVTNIGRAAKVAGTFRDW